MGGQRVSPVCFFSIAFSSEIILMPKWNILGWQILSSSTIIHWFFGSRGSPLMPCPSVTSFCCCFCPPPLLHSFIPEVAELALRFFFFFKCYLSRRSSELSQAVVLFLCPVSILCDLLFSGLIFTLIRKK